MDDLGMPQVAVVIPLYNAREWIGETVKSVLDQTYPASRLEVVIVDDGSTDDGAEIAGSLLSGSGVRHEIVWTQNGGPSQARNRGWRQARAPWIQFLDADDLLDAHKISVQAAIAQALPKRVAVVYSEWQRLRLVDDAWQQAGAVASPRVGVDPVADLLKAENFIATGSQLFRRDWLERIGGFDEKHWLIEDVDLMLRIAMAGGEFHHARSEEPLFFYRQRKAGALSRRDRDEFVQGCLRNAALVEQYWRSANAMNLDHAQVLAGVYFQGARHFAAEDESLFETIVDEIEALIPDFLPPGPWHLRLLSRMVGYRRAEKVAVLYRQARRRLPRPEARHRS